MSKMARRDSQMCQRDRFNTQDVILEPGDTIVVPRDVTNYERLGLWQTITQIAYQSAIALIAIGNL